MFSAPPLTPVVKKLIISLFAAFVLELLLANFASLDVTPLLALNPVRLGALTLVQLFTYVLVVDSNGTMLMLINLVFMWLIMSPFEQTFGKRHTLELIAAGTLGGSLAAVPVGLLLSADFPLTGSFTIAYGGMAAMTQVMGGRSMLFFGVVPMTSRQLLLVLVGFALLEFIGTPNHRAGALMLAASLGSMLAGGGYVKYMSRRPRPSPPKRPGSSRLRVLRGGGGGGGGGGGNGDSDRPKWLN